MPKKPFNEILFQQLYATLVAAGIRPDVHQVERMRGEVDKLADDINKEMKLTAITLLRRIEDHIEEAINKLDKKIDQTSRRLSEVDSRTVGSILIKD